MAERGDNPEYLYYQVVPKHHLFMHLIEHGDNPKESWAYLDESEIGHATNMAERLHTRTLNRELMDRYRLLDLVDC